MGTEPGLDGQVQGDSEGKAIERLENDIEQLSGMIEQVVESMFIITRDIDIARQRIRREIMRIRQNSIRRNYLTGKVEKVDQWINGSIDDVLGL